MRVILKVENLEKYYPVGDNMEAVLKNINLLVTRGEFVTFMGPSGCGKTTLLNAIGLIDNNNYGSIEILGEDVKKFKEKEIQEFRKNNIGFIFQEYNLLDTLNAYDNIALSLTLMGKKTIDSTIKKTAKILGISEVLSKYPNELSGGQKQRVAIARALVTSPKILLCDEPTGALDQNTGNEIIKILELINKKLNITIIMVTHDTFLASKSDRTLFLKDGKFIKEVKKNNLNEQQYYETIINIEKVLRT